MNTPARAVFYCCRLLTFQSLVGRGVGEIKRDHGWAPKKLGDGDATSENTQPSQNGGRREGNQLRGRRDITCLMELDDLRCVCLCGPAGQVQFDCLPVSV